MRFLLKTVLIACAFLAISCAHRKTEVDLILDNYKATMTNADSRKSMNQIIALGKPAVNMLIPSLMDNNFSVHTLALYALFNLDTDWFNAPAAKKAVPDFIEFVSNSTSDKDVRISLLQLLGEIKDKRAIKPLIALLEDAEKDIKYSASLSLRQLTGQDFGDEHEKWTSWWEKKK